MKNRINKYYQTCRHMSQSQTDKPAAFGRAFRFVLHGVTYTDVMYITAKGVGWPWIYLAEDDREIRKHVGRLAANSMVLFSHFDAVAVFRLMDDVKYLTPREEVRQ